MTRTMTALMMKRTRTGVLAALWSAAVVGMLAAAAAHASTPEGEEADCKIVLFRHLEKTGGSSVRSYFGYWGESFRCAGQFCKLSSSYNKLPSLEEKFLGVIANAISEARKSSKTPDLRLFIELHNKFVSLPSLFSIFDQLDELKSYGCRCFSFVMLREPLHQAISDFRYFPKSYPDYKGNVTDFLIGLPENMLRRLSLFKTVSNLGPHTKITEFDAATYPWNYQMQSTIYKRTKKLLDRFDMVGSMNLFSELWRYICDYMEMDSYPHRPMLAGAHTKPVKVWECAEYSHKAFNTNKKYAESDMSDEYWQNYDIGKLTNPVGYRIWNEYSLEFSNLIYFLNQSYAMSSGDE